MALSNRTIPSVITLKRIVLVVLAICLYTAVPALATEIVCINSDQGLLMISDKRAYSSRGFSDNSHKIILTDKYALAFAGMSRIQIRSEGKRRSIQFDVIESVKRAMLAVPNSGSHSQRSVREIAEKVVDEFSTKVSFIELEGGHPVFTWIYANYDRNLDAILLTNIEVIENHPSRVRRKIRFRNSTFQIHRQDVFGGLLGLRNGVFHKIPNLKAPVNPSNSLKLAYGELAVTRNFFKMKGDSLLSDTADVCIIPFSAEKPKWIAQSARYINPSPKKKSH